MKRRILFILLWSVIWVAVPAQLAVKKYEVRKLAEGVYGFVWSDPMQDPIEGNSLFVINEKDVLVVDACSFPSSTRIMVDELKKLTSKPVRYVVNTHWHDDHVNGNFVYQENWPGVSFIAHARTRDDMITQVIGQHDTTMASFRKQAEFYGGWLKEGKDNTGKVLDSARLKRVRELTDLFQKSVVEYGSVRTVLPGIVFGDSINLYCGEREIQVRWLGLGNTRGDIVIFLPKERIAATGDLFVYPIPFAFGSYYKEWVKTLDKVDSLQADILLPGHGFPQMDRIYVRQVRNLIAEMVKEVDEAVAQGLSLEDTKKKIKMPEWKKLFAGDDAVRNRAFDQFFISPAVERAWHQARGDKDGE